MAGGDGHGDVLADQSEAGRPGRRWLWLLAAAAVLFLVVWLAGGDEELEGMGTRHPAVGRTLNGLDLVPLTGTTRPVRLEDLDGKVTVINFWGPWCGYCLLELPELAELEAHYRERPDFLFLSVASNPDPQDSRGLEASVKEVLRRQGADFPTYRDPGGQTTLQLIATAGLQRQFGYPATVLVGRDRTIRGLWIGYRNGDVRRLRLAIEAELMRTPSTSS
jgi:thiol-disulfide isomerase/thioredoxin